MLLGCLPAGHPWQPSPSTGRDVIIADRLSFTLPLAYHETTGGPGRTFRERGTTEISYSTIHVQSTLVGAPLGLDEAFAMVIARLQEQEHFDMWDVQLSFIGDELALTYAAEFSWLDLPRRQWGLVVSQPEGLISFFMTAPSDRFVEAALDFQGALDSLHAL